MFLVFKRNVLVGILAAVMVSCVFFFAIQNRSIPTAELNSKLIVVDAGHGGMDGGGVGVNEIPEKELNLEIAQRLEQALKDSGYQVVMTRTEDVSLHDEGITTVRQQKNSDLKNRAKIANQQKAGLFVSIHMNKFESADVKGAQVFYKAEDKTGEQYAKSIMAELKKIDPQNHRVEKPLPNKNLTFTKLEVPGVLVECGFISNQEEAKKLQDDAYRTQLVNAIVNGIKQIP